MVNNVVAIGWPPKWGRVPEGVMPFYLNSLPKLTDKHMAAAEDQRRQTGPEDGQIASLIVELTRTLREDIRNRNVFVSPNRADQALIKLTERWEHIPMDQAKRELMEHVATRIKELDDTAFPQSNEVAGVISRGSRELVQEVSRSLSALLQWRPDVQKLVPDEAGIETPAERGAVTRLYEDGPRDALKLCQLDMDTVVHNLETAAGVWNAEDLQSLEISEVAITVVITMAALVQQRQNDNLHMVLISSEHPALRYSFHEGWVERPAVELAAHLSSQMASVASNRIMGLKRKKEAAGLRAVQAPLESVAVFLREQLGAYDGEETTPGSWFYEPWALRVLARFSRAAVQRCTLETPGYQALRRILSRALSVDCFGETEDILALASAHREALEKAAASSAISLQAKEKT